MDWAAGQYAFSTRFYDARSEFCKAQAGAASDPQVARVSECKTLKLAAGQGANSSRFYDARNEYCKAIAQRLSVQPISKSSSVNPAPSGP